MSSIQRQNELRLHNRWLQLLVMQGLQRWSQIVRGDKIVGVGYNRVQLRKRVSGAFFEMPTTVAAGAFDNAKLTSSKFDKLAYSGLL